MKITSAFIGRIYHDWHAGIVAVNKFENCTVWGNWMELSTMGSHAPSYARLINQELSCRVSGKDEVFFFFYADKRKHDAGTWRGLSVRQVNGAHLNQARATSVRYPQRRKAMIGTQFIHFVGFGATWQTRLWQVVRVDYFAPHTHFKNFTPHSMLVRHKTLKISDVLSITHMFNKNSIT